MANTLTYYGEVVSSLAPGLQLLVALLLAGKVMTYGSRLVYRAVWRR